MKCKYCDSWFAELPEDKSCPNCGASLPTVQQIEAQMIFPEPPVGAYKTYTKVGHIEIDAKGITLYRNVMFERKTVNTIPFHRISGVSFCKATGPIRGFLCVREWDRRNYPLIGKTWDAVRDETSVLFEITANEQIESIYLFLKECAEIVNKAYGADYDNGMPLGEFPGERCLMELSWEAVTIHKKTNDRGVVSRKILYSEISDIGIKMSDRFHFGCMTICVRGEPKWLEEAMKNPAADDTSFVFNTVLNDTMLRIYDFIKKQIEK